jgi:hypothetical protein
MSDRKSKPKLTKPHLVDLLRGRVSSDVCARGCTRLAFLRVLGVGSARRSASAYRSTYQLRQVPVATRTRTHLDDMMRLRTTSFSLFG